MRKLARETAFKIIYESLFQNDKFSCDEIIEDDGLTEEQDIDFVKVLVNLYKDNRDYINNKINESLVGYTPDRVYNIDRAIMGVALAEILFYKQTPYKVVINEAVEMAKKYSTEKSYSFVNGILKVVIEGENVI